MTIKSYSHHTFIAAVSCCASFACSPSNKLAASASVQNAYERRFVVSRSQRFSWSSSGHSDIIFNVTSSTNSTRGIEDGICDAEMQ